MIWLALVGIRMGGKKPGVIVELQWAFPLLTVVSGQVSFALCLYLLAQTWVGWILQVEKDLTFCTLHNLLLPLNNDAFFSRSIKRTTPVKIDYVFIESFYKKLNHIGSICLPAAQRSISKATRFRLVPDNITRCITLWCYHRSACSEFAQNINGSLSAGIAFFLPVGLPGLLSTYQRLSTRRAHIQRNADVCGCFNFRNLKNLFC